MVERNCAKQTLLNDSTSNTTNLNLNFLTPFRPGLHGAQNRERTSLPLVYFNQLATCTLVWWWTGGGVFLFKIN